MISVVIPTYNHLDDLLRPCLESIIKYTTLDDNVEIIIVANGCTDGTREFVEGLGEPFKLLWFDEDLGYTKATNEGIKASCGEFVVLLNNDTVLLPQHLNRWLTELTVPMKANPQVGITGPHLLTDPATQQPFLVFFCACVRRAVFEKLGLLDEVFSPGGGEDIDLCIRTRKAGYLTYQLSGRSFPIYHKGEGTFNEYKGWQQIFDRNEKLLMDRWVRGIETVIKIPGLERTDEMPLEIRPIKLNLGCGDWMMDNYFNCDFYDDRADFKVDAMDLSPFPENSVDEIYNSHLIEHFDHHEAFVVLKEWKRVLKPGGTLIMETPDFLASCVEFIKADEPTRANLFYGHFFSEPWRPGQTHKFLYTPAQMWWTLDNLGFKNIHQEPALRYVGREKICMKFIAEK